MTDDGVVQRLAAILVADVVGYSRLMGDDERGTIAALDASRAVFRQHIEANGGRVVDMAGDSVLSVFASATGAVTAALATQQELGQANAARPEGRRMAYRIGVNTGDVHEKRDGTVYGDGVNIAARLEALAEPGGVAVSGLVHETVRGRVAAAFADMGEHAVKNIAEPVHAWRLLGEAEDAPEVAAASRTIFDRPAVAVLPFDNMSNDAEQDYFVDGLTEDIITALAAWRSFPVIARNSTFAYKGKSPDIRTVGRELGARYVLEGGIRKGGNRIRITAQLIDAESGHHLWAERFDRQLEDIFELQDEITQRIAATVAPEIERAQQKLSAVREPRNLGAWDYAQRGMAALADFDKAGNARAREMFAAALTLDPAYGHAHAGMAFAHNRDLMLELAEAREEAAASAHAAALKAVELDPGDSFAHTMLAIAHMWPSRYDAAVAQAERAVALNPSNALALAALGTALDATGRHDAGIAHLQQALRINPQDPRNHIAVNTIARAQLAAGHFAEAEAIARQVIIDRPDFPHAHYLLAAALASLDRPGEARASLEACERLQEGFVERRLNWAPYADAAANARLHAGVKAVWGGK
jgi:adenylate cyclase